MDILSVLPQLRHNFLAKRAKPPKAPSDPNRGADLNGKQAPCPCLPYNEVKIFPVPNILNGMQHLISVCHGIPYAADHRRIPFYFQKP